MDTTSVTSQQVLQHELYHVRQIHSFDILFIELLISIFWFNPFFYYIEKELKTIHEFLADQAATTSTEKSDYAESLILHAISGKTCDLRKEISPHTSVFSKRH